MKNLEFDVGDRNCYACGQCKNLTTRNGALWCEIEQVWVRGNSKSCEMFEFENNNKSRCSENEQKEEGN